MKLFACILASAVMTAIYARGGAAWVLGFVLLAPWILWLDARRTTASALLGTWAMSVAYTAAGFAWFGQAFGRYTHIGEMAGSALLLLAAPLFQPQFFAYAIARHLAARWHGPALSALAAAAAWVASEWLVPRLLGDTLGYGLYPSRLLRQAADIGGAAGLTFMLLLSNEAVAAGVLQRRSGWRVVAKPLLLTAMAPALLASYGAYVLSGAPAPAGKPLRMGLIQANMGDYENRWQQTGAYAVVREVLNRHFAMGYEAVARQGAQALMWSETAYPTTFGHPKSEAGAEFDHEILDYVKAANVPLVFGTYDRDALGEYNAAAFVQPDAGLVGAYRKTHLFPFTEYLPSWLDGPLARRLLPWAGGWQPGNGARVLPLRLADGREIPVLPLICRDDVDPSLAISGARLGGQVILTMSNDSWFSEEGPGARLHQAAAAFRSIETRLPQFRVTTNGFSAAIGTDGEILAGTRAGEPALVIADLPVRSPAPTLMVLWGDWVGPACGGLLLVLAGLAANRALSPRRSPEPGRGPAPPVFPMRVAVLPFGARVSAGVLRALARLGLLGMCLALLLNEPLRSNTLGQLRIFALVFLLPEAIAWCVLAAFAAQASVSAGKLLLQRGSQRLELELADLSAITVWRLPLPGPGVALRLNSGQEWPNGLALADTAGFAAGLAASGGPALIVRRPPAFGFGASPGRWLDKPLAKFVLLPLALAIPAFHLHQHIAYGSAFGEYYSFGLAAYLSAFALWWAAWTIGVTLGATVLRMLIESGALLAAVVRPDEATGIRQGLERIGHLALYLALPGWLLFRIFGA
jgi:apolipoprotein N-acyltransferase